MNLTLGFILFMVASIVIFDFYIIFKKGKLESISAWLIRLAYRYPSIPFLLGFVCGHLFWQMPDVDIWGMK